MIILNNEVRITNSLPEEIRTKIKKFLTIPSPLFSKKMDLGLSVFGVPASLFYFKEEPTALVIPIGALSDILAIINDPDIEIIDKRQEKKDSHYFSKLKFTGTLRQYQEEIVTACLSATNGIVEAMTGSGKTVSFVKLIYERKMPTLILVNTIELAHQTIASLARFTNLKTEDVGFIGAGQFDVKPISVALHQTMAKLPDDKLAIINKTFSQVIADEVHIVAAETYYVTMSRLTAKYKFGFSATPFRADGLTKVIHFATGPTVHSVNRAELEDVLVKPTVRYVETSYYFPLMSSKEFIPLINDLSINEERNSLIANLVLTEYADSYVCLLCNRQEQVSILKNKLGEKAVMLTSKTPKKLRKAYIEQMNKKEINYIISTYGLFSTGIDIPHLDVAVLCAPIKSEVVLRQTAGRLMRKAIDKVGATIIDIVDKKIDILRYQASVRKRIFNKL